MRSGISCRFHNLIVSWNHVVRLVVHKYLEIPPKSCPPASLGEEIFLSSTLFDILVGMPLPIFEATQNPKFRCQSQDSQSTHIYI